MKYIDALKKYNEGKDRWCSPKKGSVDYLRIRSMMKQDIKTSSHSFRSKSSPVNAPRSGDYEIVEDNPEIYLINAVGDGDCFINAIFDYCLYTGKLEAIYNRLMRIELLIMSIAKYEDGVKKAKALFKDFSIKKHVSNATDTISSLTKINAKDVPSEYRKLSKRLTYFTHQKKRSGNGVSVGSVAYDKERKAFSKSMKYIQVLYIYTYGNKVFLNRLMRYMEIAIYAKSIEALDWDASLINYVKNKYYHKKTGDLKATIDIHKLLDEYMRIYAETNGYYTCDDQIFIFRKILFKRMKGIPQFWLNYETIQSVSTLTKIIKFRKMSGTTGTVDDTNKFVEKDGNAYNYISLLRDGKHYLLFVAKSSVSNVKNKKQKGGWDKKDRDFIEYNNTLRRDMPYLDWFESKILKELLLNINTVYDQKLKKIDDTLPYIRGLDSNDSRLIDNYDYDLPKFSIVPNGTVFYRRQKTATFNSVKKPIWLDYTGTMSSIPFSFLKETNEKYTVGHLDKTKEKFGNLLMKFETKIDLLILHFPSYATSYLENWVKHMCINSENNMCVDGYTLDFLKFNPNKIYKELNIVEGVRELCILNAQNVSLVSVSNE
jgi:hypothetical protein